MSAPPVALCSQRLDELSSDMQIDLSANRSFLRRSSHPPTKLPPLNLSALHSSFPTREDVCTPRRKLERIGCSLSKYTRYLYVGSYTSIMDHDVLRSNGITHILNVSCRRVHQEAAGVKYLSLKVRDDWSEQIDEIFDIAIDFIEEARQANGACAVICTQGVSRSATIALAYMVSVECQSFEQALVELRKCRPIAAPNASFMRLLAAFERRVCEGRDRDWAGRVTCVGAEHKVFVARRKQEWNQLNEEVVFVVERARWQGIVVWRGRNVGERMWKEAMLIARRMAARVNAERRRRALHEPLVATQLLVQGDGGPLEALVHRAVLS